MELEEFNKNIKKVENYYYLLDAKGNFSLLSIPQEKEKLAGLLVGCHYQELDDKELKIAKFEKRIEKGIEFNRKSIMRPTSKYAITKKEIDKFVLVDTKVYINEVWVVSNGFKLSKTFNNKDEALKYCKETNEKILGM